MDRFKGHAKAPPKGKARCVEKVTNEYGGDYSRLVDVLRCTVICSSAEQLIKLTGVLSSGVPGVLQTLRLENRFATGCEMATGYRDANFSVRVTSPAEVSQICEIQVHLAPILALKGEQHVYYEYFREYFHGQSESYEKRMALLETFGGTLGAHSIEERIVDIVNGDDEESLEGLAGMCGKDMMGNVHLLVHVTRRQLELAEGKEECDEKTVLLAMMNAFGNALMDAGDYDAALPLCERALEGRERTLGQGSS